MTVFLVLQGRTQSVALPTRSGACVSVIVLLGNTMYVQGHRAAHHKHSGGPVCGHALSGDHELHFRAAGHL